MNDKIRRLPIKNQEVPKIVIIIFDRVMNDLSYINLYTQLCQKFQFKSQK